MKPFYLIKYSITGSESYGINKLVEPHHPGSSIHASCGAKGSECGA
jgi:hypothetical protein